MDNRIPVYVELGARRTFASALDWPGWTRTARDQEYALAALAAVAPRYARVAETAGLRFPAAAVPTFTVVERVPGSATTDFGAPARAAGTDRAPMSKAESERFAGLLAATWRVLDAVAAASPEALLKGPRGGGRDRDKMYQHVLSAEHAYARKLGIRGVPEPAVGDLASITTLRQPILELIRRATGEQPVDEKAWLPRYAVRRMAWHVLDHAWEMEDRTPRPWEV